MPNLKAKYIIDENGDRVAPITYIDAVRNSSGDSLSEVLEDKADATDLAPVATSGDYTDLLNTPTSESAVQDGTDLSLVTTGEKYIWNNKSSVVTATTLPVSNGVYAIYADGSLKTAAEADSNALGVAVITDNCCFVIDKTNDTLTTWDSQCSTNGVISGCTAVDSTSDAKLDFAGVSNTNAIANVSNGGEAAKYCRQCSLTIGGVTKQGYLSAGGEWYVAYQNKTDVDTIMTAIGGTEIGSTYYWSSTLHLLYSEFTWAFSCDSDLGGYSAILKTYNFYVRPFYPITKQEFAGETITTNIPTVTIEQSTGSSTTNVMSLKAVSEALNNKANSSDVSDLQDLIPAQAATNNQLADKEFVNSSIATSTATYRGSYNLVNDLSLTTQASHEDIGQALDSTISTADNNDYCFVQIPTDDTTPTEISSIERYKHNGTAWSFEYALNNSGFTAAQWTAINSNITSTLVTKLSNLSSQAAASGGTTESLCTTGEKYTWNSKLSASSFTGTNKGTSINKIMVADSSNGLGYATLANLASVISNQFVGKVISTGNIDGLTSLGFYSILGTTQYESAWGTKYGALLVFPTTNYIYQIFLPTASTYTSKMRKKEGSTWSAWWTFK